MDRVSLPTIAGDLTPWIGVDVAIVTPLSDTALRAASVGVLTAPSGGSLVVQIRTATTALATVTLASGEKFGSWTGTSNLSFGQTLYVRVSSLSGTPTDLYGYLGFDSDVLLTSIERVKEFRGITESDHDALLLEIVEAVSRNIEGYIGRSILQRIFTAEAYRGAGWRELVLNGFPIINITELRLGGAILTPSTDYRWNSDNGIVERLVGDDDSTTEWALDAAIEVDSVRGYVTVPTDLRLAATKQAVHEFAQSRPGGGRLGLLGTTPERGGSSQFAPGGFLPEVIQVLDRYREMRAPWPG